jgi:hypothetical protein
MDIEFIEADRTDCLKCRRTEVPCVTFVATDVRAGGEDHANVKLCRRCLREMIATVDRFEEGLPMYLREPGQW